MDGQRISIVFYQMGKRIIEYTEKNNSVTISNNEVILHMTPEETAKFSTDMPNAFAAAQINIVGDAYRRTTCPVRIPVHANLKSEVM